MKHVRIVALVATVLVVTSGTAIAVTSSPTSNGPATIADGGQSPGVLQAAPASYQVSNLSVPATAQQGETVEVTADVTNPNAVPLIRPVELRVDGKLVERRQYALNPGETDEITFQVDTAGRELGTHFVSVLTDRGGEVTTLEIEMAPIGPMIGFEDQTTDGTSVEVAGASNTTAPFYVAVWTINESTGDPETLLGFVQVNDTGTTNLTVPFDLATIDSNQTLVAAVHPDADGNASTVDPDTETLLATDTANVTVEAPPEPTPTAGIDFEDQTSDGTNVTVSSASNATAPFYVAILEGNVTTGGVTILGVQQVTETEAENVTVTLDDPLQRSGPLFASVHPDADGNASTVDPVTDEILAYDAATVTVGNATGATVRIDDQVTDGTAGVVANATNASAPFYVAVTSADFGTGALTIHGITQVNASSATNLTVDFDAATLDENDTVVATVHPDQDGDPATEDPALDRPLAADAAEFTVEGPPVTETTAYLSRIRFFKGRMGPGGDFVRDDRISIRSGSADPVDVGGWYLKSQDRVFQLPEGTTIPANGELLVHWNASPPGPGANESEVWTGTGLGQLSTDEEEVALLGPDADPGDVQPADVASFVRWDEDDEYGNADVDLNESVQDAAVANGVWDGSFVNVSDLDPETEELRLVTLDEPASSADGWTIAPKIDDEASVTFSNQTSDGTTVVVDEVSVNQGGFVVIHNRSLFEGDAVGSVIGVSEYLDAGIHENVTVTLFDVPGATFDQTRLNESQTLVAMPHRDRNNDQQFDFVTSNGTTDDPYTNGTGDPIIDSAFVTVEGTANDVSAVLTFE